MTIENIEIGNSIEEYNKILGIPTKTEKIGDIEIYTYLENNHNTYTLILVKNNKIEGIFTTKNILKPYNIKENDNKDKIEAKLKNKIITNNSEYKELIGQNMTLENNKDKISLNIGHKRIDIYYDKYNKNKILGYYIYKNKNTGYMDKPNFKDLNLNKDECKIFSRHTLDIINTIRKSNNIDSLKWNNKLEDVSVTYSDYSIKENYHGHIDKEGLDPSGRINKKGYKAYYVGENILTYPLITPLPSDIINSYIHSEGHRKNILNSEYEYYGAGISSGSERTHNTQMFSKSID